jgi:hypothetical protein
MKVDLLTIKSRKRTFDQKCDEGKPRPHMSRENQFTPCNPRTRPAGRTFVCRNLVSFGDAFVDILEVSVQPPVPRIMNGIPFIAKALNGAELSFHAETLHDAMRSFCFMLART